MLPEISPYCGAAAQRPQHQKNLHTKSHGAATIIGRYVCSNCGKSTAAAVEARTFLSEQAPLDVADVDRQIAWYKVQDQIDKGVNRATWLI